MNTMESIRILRRTASPLLLCVTLAACRGLVPHGPIDSGLAAFVPPDAQALAGVRIDRIRATPLYRKIAARNRLPAFPEFRAESGIDPDRDLQDVLLASDGKSVLAIARGTFPAKPPGELSGGGRPAIAFVGTHTALAGPAPVVRAALDRYRSGRHSAPRDLLARVEALPGDSQIWAVTLGWSGASAEALGEMGNAANLDRILRSVESASLTADLRAGLHATATGDCRTDQDAKTLAESLQALLALARASVSTRQPDMEHVFAGVRVTQAARSVKVTFEVPEDLAEKLVDGLP